MANATTAPKTKGNPNTPPAPAKNRAEGLKIKNTLHISPKSLILTEKFRGRAKPVGDDVVVERADSLRIHGQQQAIQAREVPGSTNLETVFGNTRVRAANLIVDGYVGGDGKTYEPNPNYLIRVEVVEVDDETALKRNLIENHERSKLNAIDNAKNHETLRTLYNMSDAAITKFYGYGHQATVTNAKKLLKLEEEYQNAISDERLTASAGFLLAGVEPELRSRVWTTAVDAVGKGGEDTKDGTAENGAIGSTAMATAIKAVNKLVKDETAAATATNPPATNPDGTLVTTPPVVETPTGPAPVGAPSTGFRTLAMSAFKNAVKSLAEHPDCPDKTGEVCMLVYRFAAGEVDGDTFAKELAGIVGGQPKPKQADTAPVPAAA